MIVSEAKAQLYCRCWEKRMVVQITDMYKKKNGQNSITY